MTKNWILSELEGYIVFFIQECKKAKLWEKKPNFFGIIIIMDTIYDGGELFDYLVRRKTDNSYYRGQQKEYKCPLVPSDYRDLAFDPTEYFIENRKSLRRTGNYFYHYFFNLDKNKYSGLDEKTLKDILDDRNFCIHTMKRFQNAFGYLLAQIIAQQIGFKSQALDVTDNLVVAFSFAIFKFQNGVYQLKEKDDECSIIYKWEVDNKASHLQDLNSFDYYNCTEIINSNNIINEFGLCDTYHEFLESIAKFKNEINFNSNMFDLEEIVHKRPFEIIKFPRELIQKTRICRQYASLLIPDCYPSIELLGGGFYKQPTDCDIIEKGILLEDLSKKKKCEKYYFKCNDYKEFMKILGVRPEDILPKNDIMFEFLNYFLGDYYYSGVGTPTSDIYDFPGDLLRIFNNYEYKFVN